MLDFTLLKVISILMDYPRDELFFAGVLDECRSIVGKSVLISPEVRQEIITLTNELENLGDIEAQARYDSLFERGRALSLWLFEHVHGESRDRGQAMVDLMAQYEKAGFEINVKELPDYLPMYLEFLSYQATKTDDDIAIRMEIARLIQKNSSYASLFKALLQIAGKSLTLIDDELAKMGKNPEDDTTFEAIDKEWEEEMVDFMAAEQEERCPSNQTNQRIAETLARQANQNTDVPVHWVGFNTDTQTSTQTNSTSKHSGGVLA